MKKTYPLLIIAALLLSACFEKEVAPPIMFNGEANMTIAEFHKLHTLSTTNPATLIDTNAIITGIVISTDQFRSCYQELFFQDTTGGISIRIANNSYYIKYRIGQRIFVKAKDLHLGNYVSGSSVGFYQLALLGNGRLMNLPNTVENRHIFRHDIPGAPPPPKPIRGINDVDRKRDYHTLVRLENCYFVNANGENKYHDGSQNLTISRTINFNAGSGSIEARISSRSTFANDILPTGALNIIGILTMFDNPTNLGSRPPQLIIRSIEDVEIPLPAKILESFDMTVNPFSQGWENKQNVGSDGWTYYAENPPHVRVQPDPGNETECLLVSPKFNFTGEKGVELFFNYRLTAGTSENMQVLYTLNGTTWETLAFTPQIGNVKEGAIRLSDQIVANPNLQIAFKYKTTNIFPMCAIMNITVKANASM